MRLIWVLAIACVLGASAMPKRLAWDDDPIARFEQATGRLAIARRDTVDVPDLGTWILVELPAFASREAQAYSLVVDVVPPKPAHASPVSLARGPPSARLC